MGRCLVTGGGGFIGSHLVDALVATGHTVRILDDFSTGRLDNLCDVASRVEILEGNVADPQTIMRAVAGVQVVFHLAALPSVQRSVEAPLPTHDSCATGTLCLLIACRSAGVQRIVYAASSSAYGDTPGTVRNEKDLVSPMSPYAVAKLAGEHYCRCFTTTYGLETVRLRFFNIFGPRQSPSSPYSGVIARFIGSMLAGRQPIIFGDGLQSRDFTYVDNAVQAMLLAAESDKASGNVYNIGTGNTINILELVSHLNRLLGSSIPPIHQPPRSGDVRNSQADITRAQADLRYDPHVSFAEGLHRTVEASRQMQRMTYLTTASELEICSR